MLDGIHGLHSGHGHEKKTQDAMDAARDPNSSVTAEDAEHIALNQAKAAGAPALIFDPNASAEDKAKQAKAQIPAELQHHRTHNNAALVTDQDDGQTAGYDLPPPTTAGALPPSAPTTAAGAANPDAEQDVQYAKTGWAPRFGNPGDAQTEEGTLLDHQTFLEGKIDDKFFGDWYHNAGVIIFACLASWTVAVLGGGLAWVFLVMAICGTYYRTSLRRVRRNFRDDVNRQMAKARLETDVESLEWINSFMAKFWPIYAPVLCATVISSVDQVLSTSTPAFLDSMRMKFFTLGTKPPRLEHVKTYPKAEDDVVLMDWKFSFTPNDVADLTTMQVKNKVNPKIVLEVRVGKAMISTGLDVIVEDMAFSGLMRVKMKLQIPFPHIEKVEICFLERPTLDYVCKPLGGETFGFDLNFVPGLESFILDQIHANLGPMMYAPNVFPIEIAKMLAGNPVDQAIGVLQITFHGAQGLKNPDKFSGTPDPYAVVSIDNREPLGKTKTVQQNANPRWDETINVILTSLKDSLTINVFDWNEYRKDKELGTATFALDKLDKEAVHENQQIEVMSGGRARGVVQADIRFFPVLAPAKLADGTLGPTPESTTGIVKFTIESAKELDGSKSLIGQLNPYAVLLLNGKEVQVSKKLKRTNSPVFPDATKEILITDRKKAKLGLVIKDDRDLAADPIIGTYQIKLDDMIDLMSKGQEWYNLAGVKTGKAKMLLQWKPVELKGSLGGSGGYVTPIGVMRLHFQSARHLKNLETMGKSDPYVRVMLSGIMKGRTVTFKNNLNPDWDEVIYVPIHSAREKLSLEVMDEETLGKDRPLGLLEVGASDYVHQSEETGEYEIVDSKKLIAANLSLGAVKTGRGVLNYTASFFPTLNVIDPEDEEVEEAAAGKPSLDATDKPSLEATRSTEPGRLRSGTVGTIGSLKTAPSTNGDVDISKKLAEGEQEQEETAVPQKPEVPKVRITADDLSQYESGLLVFKLISGDLTQSGCHLEVVMDDNVFPAYSSAKVRSRQCAFNETGDAMIRELDLSRITLRLVEEVDKKGEGDNDHIKARLVGETITVLRQALYTPTQLTLKDKEGHASKVTVSLKFLPVKMKLDPSESLNNQGNLRVEVLDAADLPAADRNGFSDPFCKFVLQGKEVYKTKTQKKTLHPAWNEFFEVPIRSRTAAHFEVNVYDWDFGDKADFLGKAAINLDVLEPIQQQEVVLGLDGKSGTIRLRMVFRPDFVTRSRQGSSTFHGTFSAPGKIVGAPVKGVGKGAVLVGGGVVKGASFLGRGFKRGSSKHANGTPDGVEAASSPTTEVFNPDDPMGHNVTGAASVDKDLPSTPTPGRRRSRSFGTSGTPASVTTGAETGTATLSILSVSGFPISAKIGVKILHDASSSSSSGKGSMKEILKTKPTRNKTGQLDFAEMNAVEAKRVPCAADSRFKVVVFDHGTFGSSDELGEASFFVDDQGDGGAGKTIAVGPGSVVIRSKFEAAGGRHHGFTGGSAAPSVVGVGSSSPSAGGAGAGAGAGAGGLSVPDNASVVNSLRDSPSANNAAAGNASAEKKGFRRSLMSRRERGVTPT